MLCAIVTGYAQQLTVRGTVTDQNGTPVPGATVVVRNTTIGTTTNIDGVFTLNAEQGDVLDINFIGYKSAEQVVGTASDYSITLEEDAEVLDEVVVTGYMTEKKPI